MSITLQMEGIEELQEYLGSVIEKAQSESFWSPELGSILEKARRFAASISPVVTGSYRAAHRVVTGKMGAELSIDPAARNAGVPVTRYAAAVEERHRVYTKTAIQAHRLAVQGAEVIGENLLE